LALVLRGIWSAGDAATYKFMDLIRRRLLFVDGGGELVGVGFETFAQGDVVAGGVRVADEWPPVVNLPDDVPTGPSIAEVGAELAGRRCARRR
jgi:hypothetical protein